ncbi:hypothetical protein [Actinopolymorpha alba]|uniref:hypothetical protein n=1 Tax=Actinopolymorpha alba TaxID=533267 RepID=UPI00037B4AB7|nr:hypothetical protein [Actinopolymorpha alba]
MSMSIPPEQDLEVLRAQRRRVLLRQVRARRASSFARRSAMVRTGVLLRSIGYHDDR